MKYFSRNIVLLFLWMQFQLVRNVFADRSIYENCFCNTSQHPFLSRQRFFCLHLLLIWYSLNGSWTRWSAVEIKLKCANSTEIEQRKTYLGLYIVWAEHFPEHFISYLCSTCECYFISIWASKTHTQNAFLLSHMTQKRERYVWLSWFPQRDQGSKEKPLFIYENQWIFTSFQLIFVQMLMYQKISNTKYNLKRVLTSN